MAPTQGDTQIHEALHTKKKKKFPPPRPQKDAGPGWCLSTEGHLSFCFHH